MRAVSLFSGVGGFDLGFERAGIETGLQAEQDPHCLAILERHWPHVRRVSDVRRIGEGGSGRDGEGGRGADGIDLIYGGFPCQDLSVAGRRAGLGGERSGLWFEFHRVLRELRPRWCVIENVPGLLSSNSGRDFAVLLDGLDELGFDVSWAVLDAQHFGVPQRRRRVFIVGGPSRRAAEQVLSLCESCGGNPPAGGAAGQRLTDTLTVGANQTSGFEGDIVEAFAIRTANTGANGHGVAGDVAHTLDGANGQAVLASSLQASAGHHGHSSPRGDGNDNLVLAVEDPAGKMSGGPEVGIGVSGGPMYTLGADPRHVHGVLANPLGSNQTGGMRLDFDGTTYVPITSGVRRLTPLECERLQGFPDNWTAGQADSHRYRQMGNAVCVPVAEWIGHRLVAVDAS